MAKSCRACPVGGAKLNKKKVKETLGGDAADLKEKKKTKELLQGKNLGRAHALNGPGLGAQWLRSLRQHPRASLATWAMTALIESLRPRISEAGALRGRTSTWTGASSTSGRRGFSHSSIIMASHALELVMLQHGFHELIRQQLQQPVTIAATVWGSG